MNRAITSSLSIIYIAPAFALSACSKPMAPSVSWEMVFATTQGELAILTTSAHSLHRPLEKTIRTSGFCEAVCKDVTSQRLATIEREGEDRSVRVYTATGELLGQGKVGNVTEFPSDIVLAEEGRLIAFVGKPSLLYYAKMAPQLEFTTIKFAEDSQSLHNRRARCIAMPGGKIAIGWNKNNL